MASQNLTIPRQQVYEIMTARINRLPSGRSIVYDVPAGLGKTKAMLRVIAEHLGAAIGGGIVACWQSTAQMLDAISGGLPGVELRDCAQHTPKDWELEDGIEPFQGIPGLIYRGKEQVCLMMDKSTPCRACPEYAHCPYTYQEKVLELRVLRLVLGSHALLKGRAARKLSQHLGYVDHVVVDENNNAFIIEVELTHAQLARIMLMLHWQVGPQFYELLCEEVAKLVGKPASTCYTARAQASALLDAFNHLRQTGESQGNWAGFAALIDEVIDEPRVFDTGDEDRDNHELAEYRDHLNRVRLAHGEREPHVEYYAKAQKWSEGRRWARELHELIGRLMDKDDLRKLVRVDMGSRPGAEPKLVASWKDLTNHFVGINKEPADTHYLDATPHELALKYWLGFFDKKKFDYQEIRVDDQNVQLTVYASLSAYNHILRSMAKQIKHVVDQSLKEYGGDLLLVLPTIELAKQYKALFNRNKHVHVSHIQVLPGVNLYEHCRSVVIVGNYLPGSEGLTDAVTMLYARPMRISGGPGLGLAKLPPGPAGPDLRKTMQFGMYEGVHLGAVADAYIGDSIWQAIARTRPLDKPEPVNAVYIGNYDLPGYLERMKRPLSLPISFRDLKTEAGLRKSKPSTSAGRMRLMVEAKGGILLDQFWLRQRADHRGKALFADYEAARYFISWADPRGQITDEARQLIVDLGLELWTIEVGLVTKKTVFGLFQNGQLADMVLTEYRDSMNELERLELEAQPLNRTALNDLLLRLIRSSEHTRGRLFDAVKRRKEFREIEKSELGAALDNELNNLLKNGQIHSYNGRYRKS